MFVCFRLKVKIKLSPVGGAGTERNIGG